MHVKELPN